MKFDTSGNQSAFATMNSLSRPVGVAFNNSGNLLVADSNLNKIYTINPSGQVFDFITGINTPLGLGVDSSGFVYTVANGNQIL